MKRFTVILALLFTVGCSGVSSSNNNSSNPSDDLYSLEGPWTINAPGFFTNAQVSLVPLEQTGGECQGAVGYITDATDCYVAELQWTDGPAPEGSLTSVAGNPDAGYGSVEQVVIGSGLNGPVYIPEQTVQFSILVATGNVADQPGYGQGCAYAGSGTITNGGQMSGTFTSVYTIHPADGENCGQVPISFTGTEQGTPSQNSQKPAATVAGRETRAYLR